MSRKGASQRFNARSLLPYLLVDVNFLGKKELPYTCYGFVTSHFPHLEFTLPSSTAKPSHLGGSIYACMGEWMDGCTHKFTLHFLSTYVHGRCGHQRNVLDT